MQSLLDHFPSQVFTPMEMSPFTITTPYRKLTLGKSNSIIIQTEEEKSAISGSTQESKSIKKKYHSNVLYSFKKTCFSLDTFCFYLRLLTFSTLLIVELLFQYTQSTYPAFLSMEKIMH